MRFVATSATRDAANRDEFICGIRGRLGVEPEVISGDEEAALSFDGATGNLDIAGASATVSGRRHRWWLDRVRHGRPMAGAPPRQRRSTSVVCGMTERHFASDPPYPAEVAAARDDIDAAIKAGSQDRCHCGRRGSLVGLAGSVTTVAALCDGHVGVRRVADPRGE